VHAPEATKHIEKRTVSPSMTAQDGSR